MLMMVSTIEPFSQIPFDISTTATESTSAGHGQSSQRIVMTRSVEVFSVAWGAKYLMLSFVKEWKDTAHRANALSAVSG
jgi:hypothetical protein